MILVLASAGVSIELAGASEASLNSPMILFEAEAVLQVAKTKPKASSRWRYSVVIDRSVTPF